MQKTIIATSLVVLASAKLTDFSTGVKSLVANTKASSVKKNGPLTVSSKSTTISAKHSDDDDDGFKYFEIRSGFTCAEADTVVAGGLRMGICIDGIDAEAGSEGTPYSYKLMASPTGGPPYGSYYMGHQCKGTAVGNFPATWSEFGLPSDYVLGTCASVSFDRRNLVAGNGYFVQADYVRNMHDPDYNHVIHGFTNRARNCEKVDNNMKLFDYHIERAEGMCMDEEDDDGNVEWYRYDLNYEDCKNGDFKRTFYNEGSCSTVKHVENLERQNCSFNIEEFAFGVNEDEGGDMTYDYTNCWAMAGP